MTMQHLGSVERVGPPFVVSQADAHARSGVRTELSLHVLGVAMLAGGVASVLPLALGSPRGAELVALGATVLACLGLGAVLAFAPLGRRVLDDLLPLVGVGTVLLGLASVLAHEPGSGYRLVLIWPLLASCAFLPTRQLVGGAAFVVACIGATMALEVEEGVDLSARAGVAQGLILVVTLLLVGGILRLVSNRLLTSQRELERAFSSAPPGGLALVGADERLSRSNDSLCRLLGYSASELVGKPVAELLHPEDLAGWHRRIALLHHGGADDIGTDQRLVCRNGDIVWARVGYCLMPDGSLFAEVHALRGAIGEAGARAFSGAGSDELTGLVSRPELLRRIGSFLALANEPEHVPAILLVDIDRFGAVNESLGYEVGDALLVAVAERLSARIAAPAIIGRLEADTFAVAYPAIAGAQAAEASAAELLATFAEPFSSVGERLLVGATAGLALARRGAKASSFLRDAELALRRAKARGRGGIAIFEATMREATELRLVAESELRAAVGHQELVVHYQPIIDVSTGEVRALEALVRWTHPLRGLVMPGDFIPLAEESGLTALMDEIGSFVLSQAVADLVRFRRTSPKASRLRMSVNLSAYQLHLGDRLVAEVGSVLAGAGLGQGDLELELTESMLMDGPEVPETLAALRRLGVEVVLDDFGTGYSSLSYLSQYPVDVVKVDRSFVSALGGDARADALVRAIVEMARALGLRLVVEGAETSDQLNRLVEMGCRYIQGYLFSKPVPARKVAALLDGFDLAGLRAGALAVPAASSAGLDGFPALSRAGHRPWRKDRLGLPNSA